VTCTIYYDFFRGFYCRFLTERNCVDAEPTEDKLVILVIAGVKLFAVVIMG